MTMKEDFLHYIWMHQVRLGVIYKTVDGEFFKVLSKGVANTDSGPDILYAKIWIDGIEWNGSIEFHVKSSDWKLHKHEFDANYNNVILHFVAKADCVVYTENGRALPNVIFPDLEQWYDIYEKTFQKNESICCSGSWNKNTSELFKFLFNKMTIERLEKKYQMIERLLQRNNNHWEEVTYQLVARYLGQKLNGDVFEKLARRLPQVVIGKHKNNLFQLEALLFGQAGMLDNVIAIDDYTKKMQDEYCFLRKKYQLEALQEYEWKYLRLRPANFPTLRIAQFAMLMHKSSSLFSQIIEVQTVDEYRFLFSYGVSDYWKNHYKFGKNTTKSFTRMLGKSLQDIMIINVIVPILFSYGRYTDDTILQEKSISLLEELQAENNHITRAWDTLGIHVKNAFDSQALIQLTENYCKFRHCEKCTIGHEILKQHYE